MSAPLSKYAAKRLAIAGGTVEAVELVAEAVDEARGFAPLGKLPELCARYVEAELNGEEGQA